MTKKKSIKPSVNRRRRKNAPMHKRRKKMNVALNKELKEKYPGVKRLPVRQDDVVEVVKGQFVGVRKRVSKVRLDKMMIEVDTIRTQKTDGTEIFHPISPSNCRIVSLGKLDSTRHEIIDRRRTDKGE